MEKHSMRHLLWAALFLLYCSCGCLAAVVQQLPQKGESALQAYTVSVPASDDKNGEDWKPIRISVNTKIVEDVVKLCERIKKLEHLEDEELEEEFEEILLSCINDDNNKMIMAEKKEILLNKVLPKAIKLHADRLKVKRLGENKKSASEKTNVDDCHIFGDLLDNLHEIPDVDFMIFVSLSVDNRDFAICSKDNQGRPTSAVIKFDVKEIKATRQFIRLTAHEIAHGLGFEYKFMDRLGMIKTKYSYQQPTGGLGAGKQLYMVELKNAVDKLKEHLNCDSGEIEGLYLENEAESPTPSHWERRIAKDELMSTYSNSMGVTGMYYTNLTLAAFHSMPFYSANFSMAEPMSWGKQYICDLFKGIKDLQLTNYPDMFCKDDTKVTLQCTSDRFALGICSTKDNRNKLSGRYQYFKDEDTTKDANDLMDGVPFIRPLNGTACEGGEEELMPGSIVSSMSRCLNLETPILKDNKDDVKVQAVCANVKCDNDNKKVSVQLKGHDNKELNWYKCENDGESIPLEDSLFNKGSVKCPNFKEVCTGLPKTEPTKIKFYNGTKITESYVDVKDDDENEEPAQAQNTVRTAGASAVANQGSSAPDARPSAQPEGQQHPNPQQEVQEVEKEIKSQTLSLKHPESENAEHTGSSSVTPGSNTGSGGNNNDNGSNEDQNMGQARESASTRVDVPSGQSLSSPPAAAGSATIDPANTVTREISQQPADQPAQNNDKQNENETPAEAQDHQQVPNQTENKVQSPTEAKAQTDDSTDVQNNTHGEESTQRNRHDTATTFSSAANSNGNESTIQSPHKANNGVLNGTNLTEDQIKEETLKHTNVTGMLGPDSSIMVSYMAPLALLVCVVGFMMVP